MKKILLGLSILSLSLSAAAQPTFCPDPREIRQVGISHDAFQDNNGLWYTGRLRQSYGTPWLWSFGVGSIPARTQREAVIRAQSVLPTLRIMAGPVLAHGRWGCLYQNRVGYLTGAITPPLTSLVDIHNN